MAKQPDRNRPTVDTSVIETDLLTPAEAALFLRSNVRTMERWRATGAGPRFVKQLHRVFYRWGDLQRWIDEQTRTHTRAQGAPAA